MSQHDPLRQRFQQAKQPFVTGRGLDHGMKPPEPAEVVHDGLGSRAAKPLVIDLLPLLVDDTNADSLFVEVDADVIHGGSPFVETRVETHNPVYHELKGLHHAASASFIVSPAGIPRETASPPHFSTRWQVTHQRLHHI